jgi:sialic acid synthase SpsE
MFEHAAIVAEAAQGYEGEPSLAHMLVHAAADGGADLVKFQLVYADELATPAYQYYSLFKGLEMPDAVWQAVAETAAARGIGLAFDVFGPRSLDRALALGAAAVKIHATDFFNAALVSRALARASHVLLSAGGIHTDEIAQFVAAAGARADIVTLLYGFQAEPTPMADNNLARLRALRERFPTLRLGFMDHADGDADEAGWLGALALPFGVSVIEKHITVDRDWKLEDYVSALDPSSFRAYVKRIRAAEAALGSASLALNDAELAYRRRAVKVLVASRALEPGVELHDADLRPLRAPTDANRQPIHRAADAIGRKLARPVGSGEALYFEDFL